MIQPRLGVNWDYSDRGSVYANFARYNPSASSLARAASWDRNLRNTVEVDFDANGNFIESEPLASSSGKWFDDGLDPRFTNEFLVGTTWDVSDQLSLRGSIRHRKSENFWEDTNNNARIAYPDPEFGLPAGVPAELYIPNLGVNCADPNTIRGEICGSSYVIAELDGAYTKYWEVSRLTMRRKMCTSMRRIPGATTTATSIRTARRPIMTRRFSLVRQTSPTVLAARSGISRTAISVPIVGTY